MIPQHSYQYTDRRQQGRLLPKQRTYIVSGSKSGLIVNVNKTGLAFDYVARRLNRIEKAELSIVCCDDVFCERLPFKTVYDREVPHSYEDPSLIIRRCGVTFENIAPAQKMQLEQFLQRFSG